jgi:hypothetical protein
MRQGRHEALSNRIVDDVENDWNGVGRLFSAAMIGVPLPTMRSGAERTNSVA